MVDIQDAVARLPARRVAIADIARDLGISKAAVSYAFNGQAGDDRGTRQRVLDRAAELGWHASSSARALSGAQTGVVGLALARPPDLLTIESFFMHFLAGIEKVLTEANMSLLLRVVGDHPDEEIHVYERWWGERRIDGVILMDERYRDPRIKAVERIGLPAVLCGGPVKNVAHALSLDGPGGGRRGRRAAPGRPRSPPHRPCQRAQGLRPRAARRRGVRRAAAAHGVEVVTVEASYTGPQAGQVTHQLLSAGSADRGHLRQRRHGAVARPGRRGRVPGARPARPLGPQLGRLHADDAGAPSVTALHRDTPAYGALAAGVLLDLARAEPRPGAGAAVQPRGAQQHRPRRAAAERRRRNGSVTYP